MAKHAGGRPSKYRPKFVNDIVKYFSVHPYTVNTRPDGSKHREPCDLPTFEGWASSHGVHIDTLQQWQKDHEEFSVAVKVCRAKQKEILTINGLNGLYSSSFCQFCCKNYAGMVDKQEVDQTINGSVAVSGISIKFIDKEPDKNGN